MCSKGLAFEKNERRPVLLKCRELGRTWYEMNLQRFLEVGHSRSGFLRAMEILIVI